MSQHLIVVLVVAVATLQLVASRPADGDAQAQIVKFDNDVRIDGYDFAYEARGGSNKCERRLLVCSSGWHSIQCDLCCQRRWLQTGCHYRSSKIWISVYM
nr:unnamed protein product [Callosobruchus analis]